MRTIKINDKDIPICYTGETVLICLDELKSDLFKLTVNFTASLSQGQIPPVSTTAQLVYAGIKTANPDTYKSYRLFMQSTKLGAFINANVLNEISAELDEVFEFTKQNEEAESNKDEKNVVSQ